MDLNDVIYHIPAEGIGDWLEEHFGGVIGYVTELLLELSKGRSASNYISSLYERVNSIFSNVAEKRGISEDSLATIWLRDIKFERNTWDHYCNAGLCGRDAPRGVIFTLILEVLFKYAPKEDVVSLVAYFRSKFTEDPGLHGCLLKLEEILRLKAHRPLNTALISCIDGIWKVQQITEIPRRDDSFVIMVYDESNSKIYKISDSRKFRAAWYLIKLPSGFDVIDVALMDLSDSLNPTFYDIQITRCSNPFVKHYTFDTCPLKSKERLENLFKVILRSFRLKKLESFFPRDHFSDYYFSPVSLLTVF
jgi:hypothetical protein